MAQDESYWSGLWKNEEWLAVWIGFFIIILMLAGFTMKLPGFKWVTDGQFASFAQEMSLAADALGKQAGAKGETALQTEAVALKAALDKGDRKAAGEAGKKFEEAAKAAKDPGLKKNAAKVGKDVKDNAANVPGKVFSANNILSAVYLGIGMLILSVIAMALMGAKIGMFIAGFPIIFIIAWISLFLAGNFTVNYYGLEYVLWCLFIGLFISNVIGIPDWLREAVRTEFYIKTGLVILGSGILFKEILEAGALGIIQAVLVVGAIWYFTYWFAKKLKVDDEFAAILSSAVSICGVSAAIATSGAIKGDPKKLSYTTSIVLICAVPMLVLQPLIAKWVGMPDVVAGAWLGGTLDTSGSVVAAGALISEAAMKVGVIVKDVPERPHRCRCFYSCCRMDIQEGRGRPRGGQTGSHGNLVPISEIRTRLHHCFLGIFIHIGPENRKCGQRHIGRDQDVVVRPGIRQYRPGNSVFRIGGHGWRKTGCRLPRWTGRQYHLDVDSGLLDLRWSIFHRAGVLASFMIDELWPNSSGGRVLRRPSLG